MVTVAKWVMKSQVKDNRWGTYTSEKKEQCDTCFLIPSARYNKHLWTLSIKTNKRRLKGGEKTDLLGISGPEDV